MIIIAGFVFCGASWICSCGGKGTINSKSNVSSNGNSILSESDKPSVGKGLCSNLQGAPCSPTFLEWKGTSDSVKIDSDNALLSSSVIPCIRGGLVSIADNNNTNVFDGADSFDGIIYDFSNKNNSSADSNKEDTGKGSVLSVNANPNRMGSSEYRRRKWCCGRCPKQYEGLCDLDKVSGTKLWYENSSNKLKDNMSNDGSYFDACTSIEKMPNKQSDIAIAHHHLIPGNQCLLRHQFDVFPYELLIKLSNLFDYNINNIFNGILLPTFSAAPSKEVQAKVYAETMNKLASEKTTNKMVGSQLHIGSHTYENHMQNLYKLIGEVPLRCYDTIVNEMLGDYIGYLTDKYETTCYMRDYENERNDFYNRMNSISEKLRLNIKEFPKHKISRNQAYVSFAAMAFDVLGYTDFIEQFDKL